MSHSVSHCLKIILKNDATSIEIILDNSDFFYYFFNAITVLILSQNYKNYGIAFPLKNEGAKKLFEYIFDFF